MKNKTKIVALLISSLMCTTYSVNAQNVYGGYNSYGNSGHSTTTHTPTIGGGYRSQTYSW